MNFKGKVRSKPIFLSSEDGSIPTHIKIFPKGIFQTVKYGQMPMTDEVLDAMMNNFEPDVRPVSIDRDHHRLNDTRAAGWIEKLIKKDDGLYADVSWTPYGERLVSNREYRMLSPEFTYSYVDSEDSSEKGATLLAVALTNRPVLKSIGTLTASDLTSGEEIFILQDNSMTIKEILAKPAADRTQEEAAFITEHKGEMTDDQTKQYEAEVASTKPEETVEEKEQEVKEETEPEPAEEKVTETKEASALGDQVTIAASELQRLQALEEQNTQLLQVQLKTSIEQKIDSYILSTNKETKILSSARPLAIDFLMSLNDSQRDAFYKIADQLPSVKILGESGKSTDENSSLTAAEQLVTLTNKKAKEEKISLQAADILVKRENPELVQRYLDETKNK